MATRFIPLQKCKNTATAAEFLPARLTLPQLRAASKACRGCDLYCNATQTVFGEGPRTAAIMLVGEQPGDQEDLQGKPFVGPAGRILDTALDQAGIDRAHDVYVTNAVKHFKWQPRGKRRIHTKPNAREIAACLPWLEAEVKVVKPKIVVALGATAAQAMFGAKFRVSKQRGELIRNTPWAPLATATVHPASILRQPDDDSRHRAMREFTSDMKKIEKALRSA